MNSLFAAQIPLIAVSHLPPLAGASAHTSMKDVIDHALWDLKVCEEAGIDGLLLENENDRPYDIEMRAPTVAAMSAVLATLMSARRRVKIGVEYLINDPMAGLATAYACGAEFIRTDYFVDRMGRPEYGGEMKIDPQGLTRLQRHYEKCGHRVEILADVQVKYVTLLEEKPLWRSCQEAHDLGVMGSLISGVATGSAPLPDDFKLARSQAGVGALYIGSGLAPANAAELLPLLDGAVVGTSLMSEGRLDSMKAGELMDYFKRERARRAQR